MEFGNRLKTARLRKGMTQKELGARIGVTEVTVGNWERGVKLPGLQVLISLGRELDVSIDALAGFEPGRHGGTGLLTDPSEKSLLEKYRTLDRYGKQAVESVCDIEYARLRAYKNKKPYARRERGERARYIPLYASPSAAGFSVPLDGDEFEMILVDRAVPEEADFAVWIQGDSMAPYISDGEMVFIDRDAEIRNGDVGIFSVDGAMVCKQYYRDGDGNVHLLSANPARRDANIFLSADSGSTFAASGKVIMESIPLPGYFMA